MRSRKILLTLECGGEMSSLTVAVNLTVDSAVRYFDISVVIPLFDTVNI